MSKGTTQLALFGGEPAFKQAVVVGKPNQPRRDRFLQLTSQALDSGQFSNGGDKVRSLERKLCEIHEVPHGILVSNATSGLQILARALELQKKVAMPAWTFAGTAHAFEWLGLQPVFCDVRLQDHLVAENYVDDSYMKEASAIVAVHLWGNVVDALPLEALCQRHNIPLIFDAAHAYGCSKDGTMIGNFGTAEVISLHATKVINSFEGGVILTRDASLASACRQMINFGKNTSGDYQGVGTNAKLNEISASMAIACMEQAQEFVEHNQLVFEIYRSRLDQLPGLHILDPRTNDRHNYHYVVVQVDKDLCPLSRDFLLEVMKKEGVILQTYFSPGCHKLPPYVQRESKPLPNTEILARQTLCLPSGSSVSAEEALKICELFARVLEHAAQIQRSFNKSA